MTETLSTGRGRGSGRWLLWALLFCAVVAAILGAIVWKPAIAAITPPTRESFRPEQIRDGATLAAGGFCATCHTAEGGKPLAGGRPLATPFGTIYGTNITPDRDTGIGAWSLDAFRRAMRQGVDREGRHLYPAFPYNHYTQLIDADIEALYAYLMTREPVRAETPAPNLRFPYNLRPLLAGWKLLFLDEGPSRAKPTADTAHNRGAYLAEALAHCSACHSPRNAFGAERLDRAYAGGEAENWWAPPLDASSPAPLPWTEESLFNYLRAWDSVHGGAVGPMGPVTAGLAQLPPDDVRAIARYIWALSPGVPPDRQARTDAVIARTAPARTDAAVDRGAEIYRGACASCHESGGTVPFTVKSLAQHTTLHGPDPRNVLQVVLNGIEPRDGEVGAVMPAFRTILSDAQVADLAAYLRARFTDEPVWTDTEATSRRLRADPGGH